jgi:excisionase family DNA binding protein
MEARGSRVVAIIEGHEAAMSTAAKTAADRYDDEPLTTLDPLSLPTLLGASATGQAADKPPRFEDLPEMVTVEEMGAFLRISRNAAYDLVKSGAIRSVKFGRLIRIPKQALLEGR